jgi:hypothetical protein
MAGSTLGIGPPSLHDAVENDSAEKDGDAGEVDDQDQVHEDAVVYMKFR